jgi:predicted metal-dependent peptidase
MSNAPTFLPAHTYAGLSTQDRITRSHSQIMRHPDFCLLSGIVMVGKVTCDDKTRTACTDGESVWYGNKFVQPLTEKKVNFLVLHENGHKAFCHMSVWEKLVKANPRRANKAMDYVVNGWIIDTDPNGDFAEMPEGALYEPDWSRLDVLAVYKLLEEEEEYCKGDDDGEGEGEDESSAGGEGDGTLDDHDHEGAAGRSPEEAKELSEQIDQALREGSILVGKAKGRMSEQITAALYPKIDWRAVMRDFLVEKTSGKDESSWRMYNRRYVSQGVYLPTNEDDNPGEIGIGIDTSGSVSGELLSAFLAEVVSMCKSTNPSRVRIMFWDTDVEREQIIEGDMSRMTETFNTTGGGGTRAGCVSDYVKEKGYKFDALIMFTDGYVEHDIRWEIPTPTLWVIDGNQEFKAPADGRIVQK